MRSVLRHFNVLLKLIYGPAHRKTYNRVYEGGRLRKRRIYRIPLLEEAGRVPGQDVATVALKEKPPGRSGRKRLQRTKYRDAQLLRRCHLPVSSLNSARRAARGRFSTIVENRRALY